MGIWEKFLDARADAIDWLKSEGLSDKEIAQSLSMGERQVNEIRTRDRSLDPVSNVLSR
jgi:DNA-binding CsgD family transcriptional regulator